MRFYTQQHKYYCGIDLHARTMYACILDAAGNVILHKDMAAGPETFLKEGKEGHPHSIGEASGCP